MKQDFIVQGPKILKEAFAEQLKLDGFEDNFCDISQNITPSNQVIGFTSISIPCTITKYNLPEQWNEALQAFKDYFKEDEIKVGDWVITTKETDPYKYSSEAGVVVQVTDINELHVSYSYMANSTTRGVGVIVVDRVRKATEEEVCNYLAEKAGLKIGMRGIFHGRKFYNCRLETYDIFFHDSKDTASIIKFIFLNNTPSILVKFDSGPQYEYIFSIQDFIDNPIKREKVFTMTCDIGTYELIVNEKGIYYKTDDTYLNVEDIRKFLQPFGVHKGAGTYSFQVRTFDAGCKKNSITSEWLEVLKYYDELLRKTVTYV